MDLYQILTHDVYLVQFETLGEKSRVSPLLTILGAKNCHFWPLFWLNISTAHRALLLKNLSMPRDSTFQVLYNAVFISTLHHGVRKVSNSKSDLQGHSRVLQCCHSIGRIRLPISLPLQLCLYHAPFPRYYHIYSVRN